MATVRMPGGGLGTGPDASDRVIMVRGKPVRFEFSRRFGPTLINEDGEPMKRQPGPHSAFWKPFGEWLELWLVAHPDPPAPGHASDKWDRRPLTTGDE